MQVLVNMVMVTVWVKKNEVVLLQLMLESFGCSVAISHQMVRSELHSFHIFFLGSSG